MPRSALRPAWSRAAAAPAPCAARAAPGAAPDRRHAPRRARRRLPLPTAIVRSSTLANFSAFSAGSSALAEPSTPAWRNALASSARPMSQVLLALLLVDEAADARARLAGDDEALPLRRRRAAARGHDLDLVAVLQLVAQRHQPAVDLGADAGVAHLAVHRVGEIHRRRAARQLDQLALRREAEHLVLVQLQLGVLQELVRRRGVLQDFQQVLHPAVLVHLLAVGLGVGRLVQPVRGDAVLGDVVHLRRCGSAPRSSGCAARAASPRCAATGSRSISASRCSP